MGWKDKGKSVRLADFPAAELEALDAQYPCIRFKVEELRALEITRVFLPNVDDTANRLGVLRELEARGDLWISLTAAGNLFVAVRQVPELPDGEDGYVRVLRRPATTR